MVSPGCPSLGFELRVLPGNKNAPTRPSPYSIFDKSDLEAKIVSTKHAYPSYFYSLFQAKQQAEIEVLRQRAAERRAAKQLEEASNVLASTFEAGDVPMERVSMQSLAV